VSTGQAGLDVIERETDKVPPEQIGSKLKETATHYKEALELLSTSEPNNALIEQARAALEVGYFSRAEKLLDEAIKQNEDAAATARAEIERRAVLRGLREGAAGDKK